MRILLFSNLYPNPAQPGLGLFVEQRLRALLSTGKVRARVVAPVPWFPFRWAAFGKYGSFAAVPAAQHRDGVEVYHPRFPVVPLIGMSIAPLLMALALRRPLRRLMAHEDFDLIDAHYLYPDGVAAVLLGRWLGKPVVLTARGTDVNVIARAAVPKRWLRWACNRCAALITVSDALRKELVGIGVSSAAIRVLRNGVDLQRFSAQEPAAARARTGMPQRCLLSVGNLIPGKGHDLVIDALRELPGWHLWIAGGGPQREALQRQVSAAGLDERVRLLGALEQSELQYYYSGAEALVLASAREGMPNVLLEGLACGTPVCATDVGGVAEILDHRDAGVLIARRDAASIAAAVRELESAPRSRALVRRHAERFSWDATSSGQLEVFAQTNTTGANALKQQSVSG